MSKGDVDRRAMTRAWDDVADGYEKYFVPRFAPWVATAVQALADATLPPGPILVPCCGTFPELPALVASHPEREIVGIDLSPGMVAIARERAAGWPQVRVIEGDAATLDPRWLGACAGIVSVFGLQLLPDPAAALANWTAALRPGGRLSVMFWPAQVEEEGPFAMLYKTLAPHRPPADESPHRPPAGESPHRPPGESWHPKLAHATIERDELCSFPMSHPDASTFWEAMTNSGPLRALANARGEEFMDKVAQQFLSAAPAGPWHHQPQARWIVAYKTP